MSLLALGPTALAGGVGLLLGSFLNVVIYRMPAGRSIVSPPSACGSCGMSIKWHDNIPVFSWLLLRGKCRNCSVPISARYPLVELGTALFFAAVVWWAISTAAPLGGEGDTGGQSLIAGISIIIAFLYLAAISIALALIDIDTQTLPNKIVLPAYGVGAALLTLAAVLAGKPERTLLALAGGAILFALYLVIVLAYPKGMGLGDVKLAGVIGLYLGWLGWGQLAVGAFSAFLLGGVFSLVLVAAGKANRRTAIPFGPFMLAGAWVGVFAGGQLFAGYLALFGLQ